MSPRAMPVLSSAATIRSYIALFRDTAPAAFWAFVATAALTVATFGRQRDAARSAER